MQRPRNGMLAARRYRPQPLSKQQVLQSSSGVVNELNPDDKSITTS